MSLTQIHFYKILSLVEFDADEKKPSPDEILKLPIKSLRGLGEREGTIFEEVMGFRTIGDLANSEATAGEIAGKTAIQEHEINRWLKMAGLLRSLTSGKITAPKVILAGLDNAGKTSIILTFSRIADGVSKESRLEEIEALKPTKGSELREVTIHGQPMLLFDLGGQEIYRERYLKAPQRYIDGTDLVIFVIDVLDEERYSEATQYFESLAKELKNLGLNPAFAIFFHKLDEEPSEDSEFWKTMDDQASLLRAVLRYTWKGKSIPSLEKEIVFQTSILREISIFSGISDVLKRISPVQEILQGSAQEAARILDSDLLLLIADNGLELARFQSTAADYLMNEPQDFLYNETLQKLPEEQEKTIVHPIQRGQEKMYHIIATTMVEGKPIHLSYLSHVDAPPEQDQLDRIIGDTFLPWVTNYFEQM